jgi:hypothetical protein
MHSWMIFPETGNTLGWYDDRDEALAAFAQLVREDDPANADNYALFEYDEAGAIVDPVLFGSAVLAQA